MFDGIVPLSAWVIVGVISFQDVDDLGPVAAEKAIRLAGINVLDGDVNSGSVVRWGPGRPSRDLPERSLSVALDVDHLNHAWILIHRRFRRHAFQGC